MVRKCYHILFDLICCMLCLYGGKFMVHTTKCITVLINGNYIELNILHGHLEIDPPDSLSSWQKMMTSILDAIAVPRQSLKFKVPVGLPSNQHVSKQPVTAVPGWPPAVSLAPPPAGRPTASPAPVPARRMPRPLGRGPGRRRGQRRSFPYLGCLWELQLFSKMWL